MKYILKFLYSIIALFRKRKDAKKSNYEKEPYEIFYQLAFEYLETNPKKVTMDSFLEFYCRKPKQERFKYEHAIYTNDNFPFKDELLWYWHNRVKEKYPDVWKWDTTYTFTILKTKP